MSVKENVARTKSDYDRAYDAGKQAEYDAFWDAYQKAKSGSSNVYTASYMFAGAGWDDETFNPKHSMRYITRADSMFAMSYITDYKGTLERNGVVFDFKNCNNFRSMFGYSKVTAIPEINTEKATSTALNSMFDYAQNLHTIDKLILRSDGAQSLSLAFQKCTALVNLTIAGTIGLNGFDVQWSTNLSKASITSIVNALSTTTSGLTVTLSKTAVDTAFATTAGGTDGSTSAEWLALVATRSNWTIALA